MSYKINYTGGTNTDHIDDYKDEEYEYEINYTDLDSNNLTTLMESLSLMDIYNNCRASPQLCSKINWKEALKVKGFITEDTHFNGMNLLDTNNAGIIRNVNGNNFNGQITEDDWEKYKNVCQVALGSKNRDTITLNIGKVKDGENIDEIIDQKIAEQDTNKKYCITFFKYLDSKLRRTNNNIRTAVDNYFTDRSTSVVKYGPINMWNVSEVTDMSELFKYRFFIEDDDISNWDVSNVENMMSMFANSNFNKDVSKWNTSNVKNMEGMFENSEFNGFINTKKVIFKDKTYSAWDVSKVTDMSSMFYLATKFNQYIGAWDVSNVTDMSFMFEGALSFNRFINTNEVTVNDKTYIAWDTLKVSHMNSMFCNALLFNQKIKNWNVSSVAYMSYMFHGAKSFNKSINTNEVTINGKTYIAWDVSNVTNMGFMFLGAESFNQYIGSWNVSSVTYMSFMFEGAKSFNKSINTNEVTINGKTYIAWDVSHVEDISRMFFGAESFNHDIGLWEIKKKTLNIDDMFTNAVSFDQNIDRREVTVGQKTYTAWDINSSNFANIPIHENRFRAFGNSGIEENAYNNAKASHPYLLNDYRSLIKTSTFIESFPNWYRNFIEAYYYDFFQNFESDIDIDSQISSIGYESDGSKQDFQDW